MQQYKREKGIVRIRGNVDREKIEKATIIFVKKCMGKEKRNGNSNKTGTINKK